MEEQWRDIIIEKNGEVFDYTGLYQVSNLGKVRNSRTGRILKSRTGNKYKYQHVNLCENGKTKTFLVHRLVATSFIPNPDNLPVVNHKDENPSNNCVENLEWCTVQYNTQYSSHKMKGKPKSDEWKQKINKKVICLETKQVFNSIGEAEEWIGKGEISACCRGKQKSAGKHPETGEKLHWMYYEDWLALAN